LESNRGIEGGWYGERELSLGKVSKEQKSVWGAHHTEYNPLQLLSFLHSGESLTFSSEK